VTAATDLDRARRQVENADWLNALARVGLVAKGASFALVGILAIKLAVASGGAATSRQGALQSLAQQSFGKFLLILLALGFAAYALWRFAQTFFDRNDVSKAAKGLAKRAGYFGSGMIYAILTYSTVKIISGAAEQSQNQKAQKTTATVLSWPAGKWIVGAAGLVLFGVGLWSGYRGIEKKFLKDWMTEKMSAAAQSWGSRAGVVGLLGWMVVFALIGIFLVKAAHDYNAREAIGLDGALQTLANQSYGSWLLGIGAAGLLVYAVFCLFEARYRKV
jgi:C4-dicarboxylate transporter